LHNFLILTRRLLIHHVMMARLS